MFEFHPPAQAFEGYIFDCDGTLVDSMPAHHVAWTKALAEFGQPDIFPPDVFYGLGGVPTLDIVIRLNAKHGIQLDPLHVVHRKEALFEELLPTVRIIPEVVEFARKAAGIGPLSVASGGMRAIVNRTLYLAGISDLFPVVVVAEDVKRGKPAPDSFLLAAERMGVRPERCVVFEDSEKGMEAARAAGMHAVLVRRLHTA